MALLISSTLRLVYNIEGARSCSNCRSTKTIMDKGKYPHWYSDGNGGNFCNRCHLKLLINIKRILFKDKRVLLDEPPRRGICSLCGVRVGQFNPKTGQFCKQTNMHHLQYDLTNPKNYTIEVC